MPNLQCCMYKRGAGVLSVLLSAIVALAPTDFAAQGKTRNVVLIVTDGLRWQELFRGGERGLMSSPS